MAVISGGKVIEGGPGAVLVNAGAPSDGTDEVQTIVLGGTPTGGTFRLIYDGFRTSAINWSATNATLVGSVDAALEALPNIGTGGVTTGTTTMTSGIGTLSVTFTGTLGKLNVSQLTSSSSLTGTSPTIAHATSTAGVTATHRGAAKGTMLVDSDNGIAYVNTGTDLAPTWTKVGTQS
jgi:hypothetical protein